LTVEQAAGALGMSATTANRSWADALPWLRQEITGAAAGKIKNGWKDPGRDFALKGEAVGATRGVPAMTDETILTAALEASDPAERAAFLDAASSGDALLRRRVEATFWTDLWSLCSRAVVRLNTFGERTMRTKTRSRCTPHTRPPRRVRLGIEYLEDRCVPASNQVLTVTNTNPGGTGSLADAVNTGNMDTNDTIVFAQGLTGTITPGAALTLSAPMTIQGPGSDAISVSGGGVNQVFLINAGVSATISGLTITAGMVSSTTGSVQGGAIDNEGNLALANDVISNSTASATGAGDNASGGGIFSKGSLSLANCTLSGNTAQVSDTSRFSVAQGGGLDSEGPVLSVTGCTITGNTATAAPGFVFGGGIYDASPADSIVNTSFTGNTASVTVAAGTEGAEGGGYFNRVFSATTFTNLTFDSNHVSTINGNAEGGGIYYESEVGNFTNVNVTNNTASSSGTSLTAGGGAYLDEPVTWTGGLVSGNTATTGGSGLVLGGGIWIGTQGTLSGLTVSGNTASNTGGSGTVEGGGIFTDAFMALSASTISGNTATSSGSGAVQGGGIWIGTQGTFSGLTVSGNQATSTGSGNVQGGGVWTREFTVLGTSTISGNNATANSGTAEGGGIWNGVRLTVTASTITDNSASSTTNDAQGGGIWNNDPLAVTNATLFGNNVNAPGGTAEGGGLFNSATATLINDTLAANTATGGTALGGGIFNSSTLNLVNTIDYNPGGAATDPDFSGTITATQASLFGSAVAGQIAANGDLGGNQFGVNPLLGPLAFNGGPTQTLALLPGSPALGGGVSISPLGSIPATDQRGLPRPGPAGFDMGAFQTQPPRLTPPPPAALPAVLPSVFAFLVPAPHGQVGIGGFVYDPDGDPEVHVVVIAWGDGTQTFLAVGPGAGPFTFFPAQFHKKGSQKHRRATVAVIDQQVLAVGGAFLPGFSVAY
jgi:hypothetical protein